MPSGYIKNRVTEKDIRDWLDQQGYYGRSAKISDLELHAIKRPGWRQVFRFTAEVKPSEDAEPVNGSPDQPIENTEWTTQYGCVLDDERERKSANRTRVMLFVSTDQRERQLEVWSAGMLTCRTGQSGDLRVSLAVAVGFVLIVLAVTALIKSW